MRLSCPNCQTEYDIPDAALAGRARALRCANCGHQWQAGPIAPPPLPPDEEYLQRPRPTAAPPPRAPQPAADSLQTIPTYEPPPRPTPPRPDPATQSDREGYAALLEATRNASTGQTDPAKTRRGPNPWLISILVLLLLVALAWLERHQIMQAWPPSTRLFDALGVK